MSGGRPILFIIIDETGRYSIHEKPVTDDYLRGVVGGDYEAIQPTDQEMTMFVNADGKQLGLHHNALATRLARTRLRPADFVVGPVLVTGLPDGDGDVQSLTQDIIDIIDIIQERGATD